MRPRRWLEFAAFVQLPLALLLACAGGDEGSGGNGSSAGATGTAEDTRSMTEICEAYCDNGAANGCESLLTIGAPTCVESCDIPPPSDNADDTDCARAWKNHTACLAATPNVCDSAIRNEYCLAAFCEMRRSCQLPEPRCD